MKLKIPELKFQLISFVFRYLINLFPIYRRFILLVLDLISIIISTVLSLYFNNSSFNKVSLESYLAFIIITSALLIIIYLNSSQYKSITKYINSTYIYKIFKNNIILFIMLFLLSLIVNIKIPSVKELILIIIFNIILTGISRFLLRDTILWFQSIKNTKIPKVLIYGAGSAGVQLAASLKLSNSHFLVGFLDDSPILWGRSVSNVPIYSPNEINKIKKNFDQVLLAIPSLKRNRRQEIISFLKSEGVKVFQIPSFEELIRGKSVINDLKPILTEDLLGRNSVIPNEELLRASVKDKVVCVTGAGGSIGGELCNQIISQNPKKLILIEMSEPSLYKIDESLKRINKNSIEIIPILGNCINLPKINKYFEKYKIDTVFHAAAYKHVALVERNPLEGVSNNIISTLNICKSAMKNNIEKLVFISTDKAVRPTNVMGASKRLCELIIKYYSDKIKNNTSCNSIFSIVRFGNVLGSSGSVVPLFSEQISKGGPLTLTDPKIIRYFMTISEAVQLVLQAASLSEGGEIFLLEMGKPMLIKELAERMIRLSGLKIKNNENINGDIEIVTTGLRPGEKLYEELLVGGDVINTRHKKIYISSESNSEKNDFELDLRKLTEFLGNNDEGETYKLLKKFVPEWTQSKLIK